MRLFIDDERFPPLDSGVWVIARSSEEAITFCKTHGCPSFISFDHDLSGDDTAMVFLDWLINHDLNERDINKKKFIIESFDYYVHSQNPIGAKNLKSKLSSYLDYCYLVDSMEG